MYVNRSSSCLFFKVDDFEASPDEDSIVNEDPVLCTTAVQDIHTTEKGQSTAMEKTCEVMEAKIAFFFPTLDTSVA